MNPSLEFLLAFIISLEISIKPSLITNFLIIAFALVYLLIRKTSFKKMIGLLMIPFIAAFTRPYIGFLLNLILIMHGIFQVVSTSIFSLLLALQPIQQPLNFPVL